MAGDEDDSKEEDDKSDEKGDDDKKDEDHKEDEEEEDDDAGGDKDGALGKKKKPPDSMMVQRKSVSRSGAAGIAAQQIAEGADQMQMAMTVVGLAVFVIIILSVGGFVFWKVFFSSSESAEQPPIEDAATENSSGGVPPFHEMPEGDFWDSEWRAIFRHARVRKSSGGAILNLLTFRHVVKLAISSARIGPEPFYGLYDWLRMPPLQNLMAPERHRSPSCSQRTPKASKRMSKSNPGT
nr:uncharacterized protein LOC126518369 isoform X1 [Dermacentor andersoni]